MTKITTHTLPQWTEVEYTPLCKTPYLSTPFFIPKESKCFLCHEDGTREEAKNVFLVFKSTAASEDDEWEDDPIPGEIWVNVLGDDDEEIEPVKVVYLGMDLDSFVKVVHEDDTNITFDFFWRYGDVKVEKAERTDEGFVCKKENFGDEGLLVTLTPEEGNPFSMRLVIPYIGFSLYDGEGNKVHGDVEISHDKVANYRYEFVGDANNDRFSLNLDNDKLIYLCVLRDDATMAVRDMRERLAIVDEIKSEGPLSDLMMGAHDLLVKNKSYRWRIKLSGSSLEGTDELAVDAETLVKFAQEGFAKAADKDEFANHLLMLEQKYSFQWCWLKDDDWSHEDPVFDLFMRQLTAFSYINQKPIQGDQLQARNNKRKIRRCAKLILAHRAGEINLWEEDEEQRREIIHLFSTFHAPFVEALEEGEE